MAERSVSIGRDAVGNQITTGDQNKIDAEPHSTIKTVSPLDSVAVLRELEELRKILQNVSTEHQGKIGRAVDDAVEELKKPEPSKDEVGSALSRALEYAKKGAAFAGQVENIVPPVTKVVS